MRADHLNIPPANRILCWPTIFISWAQPESMSEFIRLAHMGFYEEIGKIAHGLFRIHRLFVATLCDIAG